ncbi:hypothetical protein ACWIGI_28785 [Nocardia sp. NPDC055321]
MIDALTLFVLVAILACGVLAVWYMRRADQSRRPLGDSQKITMKASGSAADVDKALRRYQEMVRASHRGRR